jgi:hypothetical protein
MNIIICYDKQVTMFFSKNFMNSYRMEHLPKMSHHTMHSPFYTTKFNKIMKKTRKLFEIVNEIHLNENT